MEDLRDRISTEFVTVRVEGTPPSEAVELFADSGKVFAVVPVSSLTPDQLARSLPALTIPGTQSFEVPTGAVIVRWSGPSDEARAKLTSAGVELMRDYGAGGVVVPTGQEDPFDLADRLADLEFTSSAKVHTIQRSEPK